MSRSQSLSRTKNTAPAPAKKGGSGNPGYGYLLLILFTNLENCKKDNKMFSILEYPCLCSSNSVFTSSSGINAVTCGSESRWLLLMRIQIRNTAELKLPILYTGTRKTKHSTDLTAQGPEGRLKRCKEYQPNNMLSLMKKEQKQNLTKLQKNSIGTPYEY